MTPEFGESGNVYDFFEAVLDIQELEGMVASFPRDYVRRLPVDVARDMALDAVQHLANYRRLVAEAERAKPKADPFGTPG